MDRTDMEILRCLKENSRMKASDISRKVNLSVSSVIDRIRKLEEQKIILGYTTQLDMKKMGSEIVVMIGIRLEKPAYINSFAERMKKNSRVFECLCITGDMDFLLKVAASSAEQLQKIHSEISGIEGVASIKSYFVLNTVKNEGFFPVE